MKKLIRRLLALALALGLAGAGCAAAEESAFDALQPLLDLTASAAMRVGEEPETIAPDKMLSQAFVHNFFLLGQGADASLGITAKLLQDPSLQAAYLGRAFASPLPEPQGILTFDETYDYIGVRIMAADESQDGQALKILGDLYQASGPLKGMSEEEYTRVQWLNQRAVVEMRRDDAAPGGWKVYAFSLDEELQMETAVADYFSKTMVEYVNTPMGYAIQYPAVFTDEMVKDVEGGLEGSLPDGAATFFVRCMDNTDGLTLEEVVAQKMQEHPAAQANINDMTGCARLTVDTGDMTRVDLFIVTPAQIYQAQLVYQNHLAVDFALYSEYMMNSFTADELGIG